MEEKSRKILDKLCLAMKSTPKRERKRKRKNAEKKDDKQPKEPLHTHNIRKLQNNHYRHNHHTQITTCKRKMNPPICHETRINWPKQPRTTSRPFKKLLSRQKQKQRKSPYRLLHTTKLAQLQHIPTNTKEIKWNPLQKRFFQEKQGKKLIRKQHKPLY